MLQVKPLNTWLKYNGKNDHVTFQHASSSCLLQTVHQTVPAVVPESADEIYPSALKYIRITTKTSITSKSIKDHGNTFHKQSSRYPHQCR